MSFKKILSAFAVAAALYFAPTESHAQFQTDLRIGAFDNGSRLFIGGGIRTGIYDSWYFNPTINYAFVNKNEGLAFIDLDAHYDLPISAFHLYAGPGVGLYIGDKTTVQLNLLVGAGFRVPGAELYVQPKFVLRGESNFLQLGFGARF
jgi:hypothetical protein